MISRSFVSAKLINLRKIHIFVYTSIPRPQRIDFLLLVDNQRYNIKDYKQNSTSGIYIFDLELPFDYPFGKNVSINMTYFGNIPVDISNVVNFPEFDEMFNYDGDDLGVRYSKESTSFALWAPIADKVLLELENSDGTFTSLNMIREEKGVYRLTVPGDLLRRKYHYVITNNGATRIINDPYGTGTSLNSEYSAVVDVTSLKNKEKIIPTKKIEKYTDAIIYEVNIRDFTEPSNTNIENKAKYLGMVEENKTSSFGDKVGLDYLKDLGITHIQLQPILDYNSNDIYKICKEYNWGYDPVSMFAIEGQYSSNPEDPQSRVEEFREMVDRLHKHNIRVVVDVVYNHMFDYMLTSLEASVPNYYFRKRLNGTPAMASGCGNDFASEKYMARKAIVESVVHLFETFDIDGIRFDLMGLMDITTINEIELKIHAIKKDAILYGEGWNMGLELPMSEKACAENAFKMPNIGFFNDSFRDILKGPTFQDRIKEKGFINGDFSYVNGFHFSFMGSVVNFCFPSKYLNANQSINYIECHDNNTVFDKLSASNEDEDKTLLYDRVKLGNALTVLSFGVPFIHMGQEIGQTKFGLDNTYNIPKVNNFDLTGLHERKEMVTYLKSVISLRNNELSFLKDLTTKEEIEHIFNFVRTSEGLLILESSDLSNVSSYESVYILINIHSHAIKYEFNDYKSLLFSGGVIFKKEDSPTIKNGMIAPCSLEIFVTSKK